MLPADIRPKPIDLMSSKSFPEMFEEDGTACASLGAVILDQHDNENAQQRAGYNIAWVVEP